MRQNAAMGWMMLALTPGKAGMVGVLAHSYPLFENRTIFSNQMMAAKQMEKIHEAAREKVTKYLQRLEMVDQAQLFSTQISGQRQRIYRSMICPERGERSRLDPSPAGSLARALEASVHSCLPC
jgi:ABC-type polar amino acid transport system ATPase subunit